jgi:signal transduction histidine kinase
MTEDRDFQAVSEIGKIFNSFLDKTLLCDFFLESALVLVKAQEGYLFLAGNEDKLWVESTTNGKKEGGQPFQTQAEKVYQEGKTVVSGGRLYVPLIVRNTVIGVAGFAPQSGITFSNKEAELATDLSSQAATALKNILLFEQNLKMERLAAIGQTMSMVLHEIKNILQLARFAQEYLRMGIEKTKQEHVDKGMEGISKAIREMEGFTYEVLSLTKDYKIQPELLNYQALLKELHDDLIGRASQFEVELDFQNEKELENLEGESRSLYRTLLNLVKNAIEASETGRKSYVRIRVTSKDDTHYQIQISDNGKGMNQETKAKLFQAFFSTKGEKGTGLGLLIIDRTIKAHHGAIQVESEEGKGTVFTLTLPKTLPR